MPVILYAGLIFYLSSLSSNELPINFKYDKIIHLIEYAILGILLTRAIRNYNLQIATVNLFFLVAISVFFYGLSDEFHQLFVPGRTADIRDCLANGLGGILGNLIYRWRI